MIITMMIVVILIIVIIMTMLIIICMYVYIYDNKNLGCLNGLKKSEISSDVEIKLNGSSPLNTRTTVQRSLCKQQTIVSWGK